MNGLDLMVLALVLLAALGGYRLGFLARTASWIGLALGLFGAARVLPWFFERFSAQGPTNLALLGGLLLLLGALLGQAIGVVVGARLRLSLPDGGWHVADHAAGAAAGVLGVLVAVWMLLPTLADTPGTLAAQTRNSFVARTLDDLLPPAPDTLVALRRLVGEDNFPRVFDAIRPAPDVGPPPGDPGLDAETIARVAPSTVKLTGIACNRVQEGSGFVTAGSDVVVTNAHVVAGIDDVQVERDDGAFLDAFTVAFDPDRDLAVLRVPGLDRLPLPMADAGPGPSGGAFGYPGGAPLRVAPFAIADEVRAIGADIYDERSTERQVLVLAASLQPGDSGSALVDASGTVLGVSFAIAPDDPQVAYALDITEVLPMLDGDLVTPVDTGRCLR